MKYPMKLTKSHADYDDTLTSQTLEWDYDNFKGEFFVQDLWDCPEDACIGRDLFNAPDFLEAIRFGMDLARKGYDDIEVIEE